jgi:hypothetical protein
MNLTWRESLRYAVGEALAAGLKVAAQAVVHGGLSSLAA